MTGIILASIVGIMSLIDLYLSLKYAIYSTFEEANILFAPLFASGRWLTIAAFKLAATALFVTVIAIHWPGYLAIVGVIVGLAAYGWLMLRHYKYWKIVNTLENGDGNE